MGLQPKPINPFAHTTWPQGYTPTPPAPAPQMLDPRLLFSPEVRLPMPTLPGPVIPPAYVPPNLTGMREKAQALYAPLPAPAPRQAPVARPKAESVDMSPFIAEMQRQKPKDHRVDETQFKNDKFMEGLAAAALASTQSDDIGEVIALAGGAFLGASKDADRERKAETRAFEEELRGHEMQMTNFRMQAEEMRVNAANTNSEIDFLNSSEAAMHLDREADRHEAWLLSNRSLAQQGFSTEMDLAGLESDIANNAAQSAFQQATVQNDWETTQALRAAGTYKMADDGLSYSWDRFDPKTGEQVIQNNIPLGKLGEYQAILKAASLMPGPIGANMSEKATNALGAQLDPVMYKQHVLSQILLHPKVEELWAPKSYIQQADGSYQARPLKPGDPTSGPQLTIPFIGNVLPETNAYKMTLQKIEAEVDAQIASGKITPEEGAARVQEMMVHAMSPYFSSQIWKDVKGWNDPKVNAMLEYIK